MLSDELPVVAGRARDTTDQRYRENIRLVDFVISRYFSSLTEKDDARQEGRIALWHACRDFRDDGGALSTYAISKIYWNIRKLYDRRPDARLDVVCSTDDPLPGTDAGEVALIDMLADPDSAGGYDRIADCDLIDDLLAVCSDRQRRVLDEMYRQGRILSEVGTSLGVSGERVRQIQARAFSVIRASGKMAA